MGTRRTVEVRKSTNIITFNNYTWRTMDYESIAFHTRSP